MVVGDGVDDAVLEVALAVELAVFVWPEVEDCESNRYRI
jgi:hypothetical protein